jgi:hypothetical protein
MNHNFLPVVLRRAILPSLLVLDLSSSAFAFPSPVVPCPLPGKDSQTFLSVDELAPPIFRELQRRFGNSPGNGIDMEARDNDWQVGDVSIGGQPLHSMRRFVQAGHDRNRWYVWYEAGGTGYSLHIVIFDLAAGAERPDVVVHTATFDAEALCSTTMAHIWDATNSEDFLAW